MSDKGASASPPAAPAAPTAPTDGTLIVPGEAPAAKPRKRIKLLNRTPSPVILDDYGAIEPARCTVGGPGIAGGIVGVPTQVTVTARDANGIGIREGGERFIMTMQHTSTGSIVREYESTDRGDGSYMFQGVRADLKGMHKLSVEVNGSLVGDSPYLVIFDVDDQVQVDQDDENVQAMAANSAQANNVKERILFIQHMALSASDRSVRRAFEKFGRILKCEQLVPGKDMWMLQFSDRKDADAALSMNKSEWEGCAITVSLAAHMGGFGTHPAIMQQLHQIQNLQMAEQQASSLAQQLALQRQSIRSAGMQVEEATDTRKKHQASEMMKRLAALAKQRAGGAGGRSSTGGGADGGSEGAGDDGDLRAKLAKQREGSRAREGSHGREGSRVREGSHARESSRVRDERGGRERRREREGSPVRSDRDRERGYERDRERRRDSSHARDHDRDRDRDRRRADDRERARRHESDHRRRDEPDRRREVPSRNEEWRRNDSARRRRDESDPRPRRDESDLQRPGDKDRRQRDESDRRRRDESDRRRDESERRRHPEHGSGGQRVGEPDRARHGESDRRREKDAEQRQRRNGESQQSDRHRRDESERRHLQDPTDRQQHDAPGAAQHADAQGRHDSNHDSRGGSRHAERHKSDKHGDASDRDKHHSKRDADGDGGSRKERSRHADGDHETEHHGHAGEHSGQNGAGSELDAQDKERDGMAPHAEQAPEGLQALAHELRDLQARQAARANRML